MYQVIIFLALGMLVLSCGEKPGDAIQSLKWLEGTWINESEAETTASEKWKQSSPLSYSGFGLTMNGKDTLFYESLNIRQENGYVFFIADVGGGPVKFKLISRNDDKWVFANPEHDFPKKIIYFRMRSGKEEWLHAFAEGNGKQIPFRFKKATQ